MKKPNKNLKITEANGEWNRCYALWEAYHKHEMDKKEDCDYCSAMHRGYEQGRKETLDKVLEIVKSRITSDSEVEVVWNLENLAEAIEKEIRG